MKLFILLLLLNGSGVLASNWAQVSGERSQTIVAPADTPFTGRWGHAVAVIENLPASDEVLLPEYERSRLFVLGGDDYNGDEGGGTLHNDVYYTTGHRWLVYEHTIDTTIFGAPLPKIVSKLSWTRAGGDSTPPPGMDYREWLCCATNVNWPCQVAERCSVADPFVGSRRWSPRRHHAALTLRNSRILVLGGRARAVENLPSDEIRGGVDPDNPGRRWREKTTLMSDVWASSEGQIWEVLTPGCFGVYQRDLAVYPVTVLESNTPPRCLTDADCTNRRLGNSVCDQETHFCVCNQWQGRERHAAVEFGTSMYVMGGITHVPRHLCGRLACGEGYSLFLNDVWRSQTGRDWVQLTSMAPWRARSDFGMVVANGLLWLVGGRGGDIMDAEENPFFNDMWTSRDGVNWHLNTTSAPWSPRCCMNVEYYQQRLMVMGGQVKIPPSPPPPVPPADTQAKLAAAQAPTGLEALFPNAFKETEAEEGIGGEMDQTQYLTVMGDSVRMLDEVWDWSILTAGAQWKMDFNDPNMPQSEYVRLSSSIRMVPTMPKKLIENLESEGIYTIEGYAKASEKIISLMKDPLGYNQPDTCYFKQLMEELVARCEIRPIPYDGEYIKDIEIIEGSEAADAAAAGETLTVSSYIDGCEDEVDAGLTVDEEEYDFVCRYHWSARRGFQTAIMDRKLYLVGGQTGKYTFADDVWYRDEDIPVTVLSVKPESESSDTVFDYTASEPNVLFEYRIISKDFGNVVRNWSLQLPPIDFLEWLDGGTYTFQVRAIDTAGNKDMVYDEGRNQHTWEYVPALPWVLIILSIILFIIGMIILYLWYKRRQRKKAMERYALKRMRRRLKHAKEGDWRTYYEDRKRRKKRRKKGSGKKKKRRHAGDRKKRKKGKSKDRKGKKGKDRKKKKHRSRK